MKIHLMFGFAIALGNAVVTLICYLLGFHSDPDKVQLSGYIALLAALVIGISGTALGMRAKRDATPSTDEFSYGQALGTGVMITLFAALFVTVFSYVYLAFINPGFTDIILQAQAAKFEARGLSSDKIEQIQKFSRMMMQPAVQAVSRFISAMIGGTIISLILAAIVKRPAGAPPAAA